MRSSLMMVAIIGIAMLTTMPAVAELPIEAMQNGSDYLGSVQLGNGGFAWLDGGPPVAGNITGPTAYGLLRAYEQTGTASYLDVAKNAGNYLKDTDKYTENGSSAFGTYDPYYCLRLSAVSGDNTWSNHAATNFFTQLSTGSYGRNGNLNTTGWISSVQAARTGTWVNLRPWEFSTLAYTAQVIGQSGQESLFRQGILDGLNTVDNTDPDNVYSDLIGIAGGVRGLAMDGVTSFTAISSPKQSGINGISTLSGLAGYLLSKQNSDGSWNWHSALTSPTLSDEDSQTTAYGLLALTAVQDALGTNVDYSTEIAKGQTWLTTMLKSGDGFYSYPGDLSVTNNEVTGEVVSALPEPATMALLALGGAAALLRRVRGQKA